MIIQNQTLDNIAVINFEDISYEFDSQENEIVLEEGREYKIYTVINDVVTESLVGGS